MERTDPTDHIRIDIPPLYCPIPYRIDPRADELTRRGQAWVRTFVTDPGLLARIDATNSGEGMALIFPGAPPDLLQIVTDWTYLTFAFDDVHAEFDSGDHSSHAAFATLAPRLLWMMEHPHAGLLEPNPFTDALVEVSGRTRERATPAQFRRWLHGHRLWWDHAIWETAIRSTGKSVDFNESVAIRGWQTAGVIYAAVLEILHGAELPEVEYSAPAVQAVLHAFSLIAGWDNDLYSYGKELWQNQRRQPNPDGELFVGNLVGALMHRDGCGLPAALDRAVGMRDHMMCLFIRLREQLWPKASAELRALLDGLARIVRGHLDWYFAPNTLRYSNPDGASPGAVTVTGGFSETPSPGASEPLPIPSIRWLWEQLDH
jgi:hypothetical protein